MQGQEFQRKPVKVGECQSPTCTKQVPPRQFICKACFDKLPVFTRWQTKDWSKRGPTVTQASRFMEDCEIHWAETAQKERDARAEDMGRMDRLEGTGEHR